MARVGRLQTVRIERRRGQPGVGFTLTLVSFSTELNDGRVDSAISSQGRSRGHRGTVRLAGWYAVCIWIEGELPSPELSPGKPKGDRTS